MSSVATRIKEKLSKSGLSVHALEKKAGLRSSAVHNILYGRSKNPSITIVQAIAKALDCSVSDLVEAHSALPEESLSSPISSSYDFASYCQGVSWNAELYLECLTSVFYFLRKKKMALSKERFFNMIEEIYLYSARENDPAPDKKFIEWLITKNSV